MRKQPYTTYPGRSKEDVEYCLRCRWHSILVDYVCCDYTTQPGHHMRGCRAGVGCDKFEQIGRKTRSDKGQPRTPKKERQPPSERARRGGEATAKIRAAKMLPWNPGDKALLLAMAGWGNVARMAGVSDVTLRTCRKKGRIRRDAAEKIYEALGVDVTGGDITEGKS